MKIEPHDIPNSWEFITMGEISIVIGGGTPKTKEPDNYEGGSIPWLTPADLSGYSNKTVGHGKRFITEKGLSTSSARMVPKGTVLYTSRAPIGYVAIASNPICTNQGFKSFVLNAGVFPDYVYWYLKGTKDLAESFASGTTFLELSGASAKKLPIPIAPENEQKRIVAEIEKQFSRLDEAVENLKRVKANLKRYKASILKAAVEGKLTEEWRKSNPDIEPADKLLERILAERRKKWEQTELAKMKAKGKLPKDDKWKKKYKEPKKLNIENLPELPNKWTWSTINALIFNGPQNGLYLPKSAYGKGVPILRIDDFQNGYSRAADDLQRVNTTKEIIQKYSLCKNDLVINRVNSPSHLGKCLMVKDRNLPSLFESNMMRLQISPDINVDFVELYLTSKQGKNRLIKNAKWAVNQASINQSDVSCTPIPLPVLKEQSVIVQEVEQRLSVLNILEKELLINFRRVERLRQSILKKAFSGKLIQNKEL